jgi:hypothetical protein
MIDSVGRAQSTSPGFRTRLPRQTLYGLTGTKGKRGVRRPAPAEHPRFSSAVGDRQVMRTLRSMAIKERALARTTPAGVKLGRYRPTDALLAFLERL